MARRSADEIIKAILAIPKSVRDAVDPAVEKGAQEIVARMRYLAPGDTDDTGALKSSITYHQGPRPLSRTIEAGGPTTTDAKGFDHAVGQEFGTVHHGQSRFFWNSVNTSKKRVRNRIDRAINKAIREAYK